MDPKFVCRKCVECLLSWAHERKNYQKSIDGVWSINIPVIIVLWILPKQTVEIVPSGYCKDNQSQNRILYDRENIVHETDLGWMPKSENGKLALGTARWL